MTMKFGGRRQSDPQADDVRASVDNPEDIQREIARIRVSALANRPTAADNTIDNETYRVVNEAILKQIDGSVLQEMQRPALLLQIEEMVIEIANTQRLDLNLREQKIIAAAIVDDMIGYGPIEELLEDEAVTEIMVNGPSTIYVEKGGKTQRSHVRFRNEQHARTIATRMARYIGRRLDEQQPYVDARLPDGSRVNIVIPPISLQGTTISIRKFPKGKLSLRDLQRFNALSQEMVRFLECIAAARCNILVSGGTSSGKTTLLNTLGDFIHPTERVITIEDSAELKLDIGNLVRLETKIATAEAGSRAVTQRDLVANALRMRPDRIILGEVRREEAFDLLQAMSTGHDGSMGTLHSNSPRDTCSRLENMILMGGVDLPLRVLRSQIVSAVDFIVHAARGADGKRRVTNITEVTGLEGETIALQDVFFYQNEESKRFSSGDFVANSVNLRIASKLKAHGRFETAMEAILSSPRASED